MKKSGKIKFLSLILLFLLCTGCSKEASVSSGEATKTQSPPETKTASMLVLGDNLMHMPVVNDGKTADGGYDYSSIFSELQEDITKADIAVIGQETVLGGEELGLSGYPLFNSPQDVGKTLYSVGFNVVLHASNHIMDRNIKGIEKTLEFWDKYPDVTVLGINKSKEEQDAVKIIERGGLKFALLNYTYGTNGIPLPEGKEYAVNLLTREKVEKDIKYADKHADFVVVFPHWGNEYQMSASEEQKELARDMCKWGADAIVGSHPHVIEPCERIESENGNTCVVYYSLGNFVSRQKETKNLLGGAAWLEFTKTGEKCSVSARFTPIVTHYDYNSRNFKVYKLKNYTNDAAALHGINLYDGRLTKERFYEIFRSVMPNDPAGIEIDA